MSACCITPANSPLHASRLTRHELVAESGVSPDDLLVMNQPSLIPAPSPHQERAVRLELTPPVLQTGALTNLATRVATLELRAGIEPALSPWQGDVIPLDQRNPLEATGRRGDPATRRELPRRPFSVSPRPRVASEWCWRKDSNLHQTGFEPVTSTDWVTPALNHPSRFHASMSGAGGGSRTLINWFLRPVPLPGWATPAHSKIED